MSQSGEHFPVKVSANTGRRTGAMTVCGMAASIAMCLIGCGRVITQKATDQLIAGDAVDRSIAQIDFRVFTGKKVFLDTQFVNKTVVGVGFVTSDYIVSSIRQKMMCDGCLLQEKIDEADFIVEMRIGALGADGHEIVYGMPPNNFVSLAASVTPTSSPAAAILPSMPELSLAKKDDQMAAAKVALFAYNRRTREPIWQSGISESRSVAVDRWYFGAGPFHKGSIYGAKKQSDDTIFGSDDTDSTKSDYFVERRFADPTKSLAETPPATKPAVAATPAANAAAVAAAPAATTPAAVAAQPAQATTAIPVAAAVATTTTPAAATATTAPVAAATVPAPNPPAPGPAAPLPAQAAAAPAATPPAQTAAVTPTVTPALTPTATPTTSVATQTVNAAPAAVATPPSNATPIAAPVPGAASAAAAPAAGPSSTPSAANVPTNAPKTVPSVDTLPGGQPVNGQASPLIGAPAGPAADMLSVSVP